MPNSNDSLTLLSVLDGGAGPEHYEGLQYFNQNEIPGDFIDNDNNGYIDDYSGIDLQMNGIAGTHSGPESNNWSPAPSGHGGATTRNAAVEINKVINSVSGYDHNVKIMHVDITESQSVGYEDIKQGILASLASGAKVISLSYGVTESGVLSSLQPYINGTDAVLVLPKTAGDNTAYGNNIIVSAGVSFDTAKLAGQVTAILAAYPDMTLAQLHQFLAAHSANADRYSLDMDKVVTTISSGAPFPPPPPDNSDGSFWDSGSADNWLGGVVNNNFYGGVGDDVINGGEGVDTASYALKQQNYTITKSNKLIEVTAITGSEGHDRLTNVERLHFSDRSIAFDIDGNAGQAYRLYKAAFNRESDSNGLGFWINALDSGTSLLDVAKGFTNSAEFALLYGANSSNDNFVNTLYNNVLERNGDAEGYAFWLGLLDDNLASREQVLIEFSESNENKAQALAIIGDSGLDFTAFIA